MIGIIQISSSASLLEASPLHNELTPQQQGEEGGDRHDRHGQDRRERERIENERHEENLRRIAHDILELILDK